MFIITISIGFLVGYVVSNYNIRGVISNLLDFTKITIA